METTCGQYNQYAMNINNFALKLFQQQSVGIDGNYFISPFSIASALTMCYAGSRAQTAQQLKELLSLQEMSDENIFRSIKQLHDSFDAVQSSQVKLNVANKLYPHQSFEIKPEFVDLVRKHFDSDVQSLNYGNGAQSAATINQWVEAKTNNKIQNLIDGKSLNDLTKLILVNAIYFKGDWSAKFDKNHTYKEDFSGLTGALRKVDMMKLTNQKFKLLNRPFGVNFDSCQLPYAGNALSMTIILPNEGTELEAIESKLTAELLNKIIAENEQSSACRVHLFVPKFRMEYKSELSHTLKALGAQLPFDECQADFSGMCQKPDRDPLFISQVIHQAFIEVSEEGTEAAAATAVRMMKRCAPAMPDIIPVFKCDRPFIFFIHSHATGAILFIGKFTSPQ